MIVEPPSLAIHVKITYFAGPRGYASIHSGGGKLSAGPVTEFTMIEPTPLNRETDAASASAVLHS